MRPARPGVKVCKTARHFGGCGRQVLGSWRSVTTEEGSQGISYNEKARRLGSPAELSPSFTSGTLEEPPNF